MRPRRHGPRPSRQSSARAMRGPEDRYWPGCRGGSRSVVSPTTSTSSPAWAWCSPRRRLRAHPWLWIRNGALLVYNVATMQGTALVETLKRLVTSPGLLGGLAGGFVLSYALSLLADRRMSAVFSQFWHEQQPKLRAALKAARMMAANRGPRS